MRSPKKTTALVLAGAVGLSSVAYGIGSQAGDGSAAARDNGTTRDNGVRIGPPPGLGDLAQDLGVSESALRDALRDYHDQERDDGRMAFAAALAEALGKSADEVQRAFDELHDARHARFAARLADALGIDAAKVQAALDELMDERPSEPGDFSAALADKLGVDEADVEAALGELRPDRPGMRARPHAAPLRELAAALDVTRAELRKAFREVRAGADERWEGRRADLVAFLANRFNLSESKVEAALPEFVRCGAPGPDGPVGFGHGPDGPGGGPPVPPPVP